MQEADEFDCVVLARGLPDMDGFEFLAAVGGGSPVVVVTREGENDGPGLLRAGATEIIGESWLNRDSLRAGLEHAIVRKRREGDRLGETKKLEEDGHFVKRVLDGLFAFVGVMKPDGTLIEVNKAPLEAGGLQAEDVIGKKFWDCYWWSYSEDVSRELKTACERALKGDLVRYDVPVRMRGGENMWIDFQLAPLFDEDGRVTHLIPSGMDISARRRGASELRQTFEKIAIGLAHVAPDGRWLRFNNEIPKITGYPSKELELLTFADITHPDDLDKDLELIGKLTDGEIENYSLEKRYVRKDGSNVWVNIVVSALRDESGGLLYYIASVEDISKRVEALEELDRQRKFVERLTVIMPSVLYVFDLERKRNIWINRRVTESLGYSEDEIREMDSNILGCLIHPEDLPSLEESFEEIKRAPDGEIRQLEYRMRHRNGSWHWFRANDTPFRRGADGRVVEMIGTTTDITREKLDAEAMKESEQRLSLGVTVAGLALVEIDFMGGTNRLSKEAAVLFGLGEKECVVPLESFHATFHPADDGKIQQAISKCMDPEGDGWSSLEHRVALDDGQIRWVKVRTQVFFQEKEGQMVPARAVLAALDVTAEKRAAEKILNSEERFRQVFEYAGTGITIRDRTGMLERANPAYCKLLGYTEKELRRIPPMDLIHLEGRDRYRLEIERLLERESDYFELETRYLPKNGDVVWVRKFVSWMRGADGAGHLVALVTDVTDRRRTEQELREVSQRKDEFLAMLGHELRNPLGAIRHAVQLCKDAPGDEDTYEWSHEVIDRQSRQLANMVDDLLDVARITRGRIDLRLQTVDVAEVLNHVIATTRTQMAQRGQIFRDHTEVGGLWVQGDPVRLEQIFGNLLSNAVKYTSEGGAISLSSYREDNQIVVSVKDNGVGIRREILPHLFDLFRQEETTLDRAQGGLGIGLTVVKSLVELHGGSVVAESDGAGKGSEFTVRLASVEVNGELPMETSSTLSPGEEVCGKRILVVDDHEDAADGLARLLRTQGHDVEVRYDGAEVMAAAGDFSPEIFLLDLGLPGMDGYQLAEMIRNHPDHSGALLVAISGYAQESDRARSAASGFDHHFSKPIRMASLMEVLG